MNFKGRYWTVNGTLVAVHENAEAREGDREIRWKGHEIKMKASCIQRVETNAEFWWNENGECVGGYEGGVGVMQVKLSGYDFDKVVNPQSLESQIDIPNCPLCQAEKHEKLGVPYDGRVPDYVNRSFLKVWDWMVGKPGYDKEMFIQMRLMLDQVEILTKLQRGGKSDTKRV